MKENTERMILVVVLVVLVAVLFFSLFSNYGINYFKAMSSENTNNICAVPEGYTQEQWEQHMGHHPDRYKECLKK